MKKRGLPLVLAVALLLILLAPVYARPPWPKLFVCESAPYSSLAQVLREISTEQVVQWENSILPRSGSNDIVEVYDAQALPALEQGLAQRWEPLYLATVVIALDRSQTDASISGWRDLLTAGEAVGMSDAEPSVWLSMAAISYALEGEDYSLTAAAKLLEGLYQRGNLRFDDYDAPVVICFDYQAAAMKLSGRDMEIVVPAEGTLCFQKGFLSHGIGWDAVSAGAVLPIGFLLPDALIQAGFRLPDGRCDAELYPPAEDYERAVTPADYTHVNQMAQQTTRILRREVRHVRLFSSADGREHQLFALVYMIVLIVWTGSLMHRTMQKGVRQAVLVCSGLLVGWVILRMLKYQMNSTGIANRYAWYLYYLFQIAIPLVVLWMAWVIDKPEAAAKPPRWWLAMVGLGIVLFLTVLTNDLHNQVFVLDLSRSDWSSNYSYGPVYNLILAVLLLEVLLSQVMMLGKSRLAVGNGGRLLLLGLYLLLLAYSGAYILRIPLAWESDIMVTVGIFVLLLFEIYIRMGLLPMNSGYRHFFAQSPQKLRIMDATGRIVLSSVDAEPLDRPVVRQLMERGGPVPFGKDSLLFGNRISGGMVVWQEDMSSLNRLQRQLELSVEQLNAVNALLRKEEEVRGQLAAAKTRTALLAGLEKEIRHHLHELSVLLLATPEDEETRKPYLAQVAMLVCYIKRRCNLFFPMQEDAGTVDTELAVYLDELAEFAGFAGLKAICVCKLAQPISLRRVTLMYDLFYTVLSRMPQQGGESVFLQVMEEDGEIVMKLLLDETGGIVPEASFAAQLKDAGARLLVKELSGAVGVQLRFSGEEGGSE